MKETLNENSAQRNETQEVDDVGRHLRQLSVMRLIPVFN